MCICVYFIVLKLAFAQLITFQYKQTHSSFFHVVASTMCMRNDCNDCNDYMFNLIMTTKMITIHNNNNNNNIKSINSLTNVALRHILPAHESNWHTSRNAVARHQRHIPRPGRHSHAPHLFSRLHSPQCHPRPALHLHVWFRRERRGAWDVVGAVYCVGAAHDGPQP